GRLPRDRGGQRPPRVGRPDPRHLRQAVDPAGTRRLVLSGRRRRLEAEVAAPHGSKAAVPATPTGSPSARLPAGAPLSMTQILEADIIDLSHDGRGVARVDGKTVFIAG